MSILRNETNRVWQKKNEGDGGIKDDICFWLA